VLERLGKGAEVDELEGGVEWVRVQTVGDRRSGWISAAYVRDPRENASEKSTRRQKPPAPAAPALPLAEIARLIIARSIASYSGNCPCPYNVDRAGRRCGKRSAYSRPGGAAPICYESDVTPAMVAGFRQ
jgi:hypothetical protein